MSLRKIQLEQKEWANYNFGSSPDWQPLLGVVEEVGELAHAYLKQVQGIRGTYNSHETDIEDAVADIVIYLLDFCTRHNDMNLEDLVEYVWDKVQQRDWKQFPKNGLTE